jgi:hypothetical protein
MGTGPPATKTLVEALKKKKILTLKELCEIAKRSPMTVWRILNPLGYHTSFNFNARYYTLSEIARFDPDGLWFYRDVGFSAFGNLNRTIVRFVERSRMGMTPKELSDVLRVRVQNQVYHLFATGKVERTQWQRTNLYLSLEEEKRKQQLREREASKDKLLLPAPEESSLSESETIAILAELVRAPRSSARRIATILQGRGLDITREKVLIVIEKYDLRKKGRYPRRSKP